MPPSYAAGVRRNQFFRPCARPRSKPFTSIANSSDRMVTLRLSPSGCGQPNRPRSSRLAHTHRPVPSHARAFKPRAGSNEILHTDWVSSLSNTIGIPCTAQSCACFDDGSWRRGGGSRGSERKCFARAAGDGWSTALICGGMELGPPQVSIAALDELRAAIVAGTKAADQTPGLVSSLIKESASMKTAAKGILPAVKAAGIRNNNSSRREGTRGSGQRSRGSATGSTRRDGRRISGGKK